MKVLRLILGATCNDFVSNQQKQPLWWMEQANEKSEW